MKLIKKFWEMVSWWFFMKKIEIALWFAYKQQNHRIRKYCKHNRHRIFNDYIKVTKSGFGVVGEKVIIDVKYFTCADCKTRFFVTEEDKKKFSEYQKDEIKDFNNMLGHTTLCSGKK